MNLKNLQVLSKKEKKQVELITYTTAFISLPCKQVGSKNENKLYFAKELELHRKLKQILRMILITTKNCSNRIN